MNSIMPKTVTVPAAGAGQPGMFNISAGGKYFYLQSASASFQIQFDAGAVTTVNPGMQIIGEFSRLTFFNDTAAPITITFYHSDSPIESVAVTVAQIANSLPSCIQAPAAQSLVTVAASGTPVAFAAAGTYARTIICIPQKTIGRGGAANTGTVYVGVAGTGANKQPLPLLPGVPFVFQADTGAKFDLSSFSLDADNNGDGLVIIYW